MSKHPFAPGDVVVCVDAGGWRNPQASSPPFPLRKGALYRVEAAKGLAVRLCGIACVGFDAIRFRHISDENDAETIARIKSCKAPSDRSKVSA